MRSTTATTTVNNNSSLRFLSTSLLLLFVILCCSQLPGCHAQQIIEIDADSWTFTANADGGDRLASRTAAVARLVGVEEALLVNGDLPQLTVTGLLSLDETAETTTAASSIAYRQSELSVATLDDGSQVHTWTGTIQNVNDDNNANGESALGVATLVRQPDGRVFANFGTRARALALQVNGADNESYQITETLWRNVQDDDDDEEEAVLEAPPDLTDGMDSTTAGVVSQMTIAESSTVPSAVDTVTLASNADNAAITGGPNSNRNRRFLRGQRQLQETIVDVLVVVTPGALSEAGGARSNVEGKVAVAVQETNAGFAATGAPNVQIRVVRIDYLDAGSYNGTPNGNTLRVLSTDPEMVSARADAQADLICLVTASNEGGGIAYKNGFVSAVAYRYFSLYTFQHELLHNFGCDHNRDSTPFLHPYAHGFQVKDELRTVMSYRCAGGGDNCPRIPFPSANGYQHNGISIGDPEHDNARLVRENAQRVSNYNENDGGGGINLGGGISPTGGGLIGGLVSLVLGLCPFL